MNVIKFLKCVVLVFGVLLVGSSLAQNTAVSQADIDKYGPGYPDYCSAYTDRPECISYNTNQPSQPNEPSQPMPVESDPCYITGGYQPGCVPVQQYECLPGDPSPNCLANQPILYPIAQQEPSVYNFRLDTPVPSLTCQSGYSPHCLAIAPLKAFDHSYATAPVIPTYRVGETLEYRINSSYSGYLYVFVIETDGNFNVLYPNAYSGDAMYVYTGDSVDLPGANANYSLDVTAPYGIHKLFSVVTTQPLPKQSVDNLRSARDLDILLLTLGSSQGIYHGYSESAFDVVY